MQSLSAELEQMIQSGYPPAVHDAVRAALLDYAESLQWEVERVQFDVLYLGKGDLEKVRQLVEVAKRDPRDVCALEYYSWAGGWYPHRWARRHPDNRDDPDPYFDGSNIRER